MLGNEIHDPYYTESDLEYCNGLGLLNMKTIFYEDKVTTQVKAKINVDNGPFEGLKDTEVEGYEIHMGKTIISNDVIPLTTITEKLGEKVEIVDGAVSRDGRVFGTYIHGIFDSMAFTRKFLNNIRKKKKWNPIKLDIKSYKEFKEREYDRLAEVVRKSIDLDRVYKIMGVK